MAGKRIPLNQPQAGLNAAFAGLNLGDLPAGSEFSAAPVATVKPGRVVLRRETSGRGGKTVVVIDDFAPHYSSTVLEDLAKKLRVACGCGGTVRERRIEIQGEQVVRIRELLVEQGFVVAGVTR